MGKSRKSEKGGNQKKQEIRQTQEIRKSKKSENVGNRKKQKIKIVGTLKKVGNQKKNYHKVIKNLR